MKKLRTVAVDDEPLALGLIAGYIEKTPFLELVAQFENPVEAYNFINSEKPDLVFLDIQMPDLKGTDLASALESGPMIIFTTAYKEYAFEGFELDAVAYLHKPVSYARFLKAASKAQNLQGIILEREEDIQFKVQDNFFFVKIDLQYRKIYYHDILYFEGLKDYIKMYVKGEKFPLVFHATLKSLVERLPVQFMRIHRSFIVNLDQIETVERNHLIYGNERIPISEQYRDSFSVFLKERFL